MITTSEHRILQVFGTRQFLILGLLVLFSGSVLFQEGSVTLFKRCPERII